MKKFLICMLLFNGFCSNAQSTWKEIGQLKTRNAKEIKSSTWSIGAETLDRDYTDYQSYKRSRIK